MSVRGVTSLVTGVRRLSTHQPLLRRVVTKPKVHVNVVRPESVLKSIVMLDQSQPVYVSRLDDISNSPKGWIERMVPPPDLGFNVARVGGKFEMLQECYRGKWYTLVRNVSGDRKELEDILRWRFGKTTNIYWDPWRDTIKVKGFHPNEIIVLLLGLGF